MAYGVTKQLWEIGDILDVPETWEAVDGKVSEYESHTVEVTLICAVLSSSFLQLVPSGHLICMLSMVTTAGLFGRKPNLRANNSNAQRIGL